MMMIMKKTLFSSSSSTFCPLTTLLILVFLLRFAREITGQDNLINQTCKTFAKADPNIHFTFCQTTLQAAPASHCATLRGLGMINLRLIRYNVTDTRCHVKQLLKNNPRLDPYVKNCLNDCFDLYSDAIDYSKQAMKSYNSKKFDDANVQISAVLDAATTCEDGFKEKKVHSEIDEVDQFE
ncbi:OLC1v1000310C1 [Oldenlandia corymbosa var. corymbosa]|uniref:OLC1v1000310C1 n=1 Tax=Oldenlandia corymbosa var. corymbosa TaxID=529605 RepID=A0AAV1D2G1_OLDCO|nr:OLC1v1000310C1 [Oldenlandia corymbosa var. corymbosa]